MKYSMDKDLSVCWMQALKKIAEVNMKKAFREALNAAETVASDENGFCACQDGVHEDADAVHEAVLKAQDQKASIYACLSISLSCFS